MNDILLYLISPNFLMYWSVERFGVQPMPFDGFLFANRVMVAKKAHTSSSVKDLIVTAAGVVEDSAWEGTYTKPTGGILTVWSELGEPIHKVATRAVKLWKEFDDSVFKLPKEKQELWLAERKEEIIGKLNKDFAKPWFGWKKNGSVAVDLGDMTYEETVLRMVRLMFVSHEKRWVNISLRNLTGDWLRRGGTICGCKRRRCQVVTTELFISERSTSVCQVLLRGLSTCGRGTSCSGGHSLLFSNFATTRAEAQT